MHTEELDCVTFRYNPKTSIWVQDETLYGMMDIARNELRGNRVGRVFGSDQFKVFLWLGANMWPSLRPLS